MTTQLAAPAFGPALRRLQTIPGVGPIVAATVLAVFSDVRRFADAKHAASDADLVPTTYHSATARPTGGSRSGGPGSCARCSCEAGLQDGDHRGRASARPIRTSNGVSRRLTERPNADVRRILSPVPERLAARLSPKD